MIEIIGIKRIATLGILAVLNILLAVAVFTYLEPENAKLERELRGVRTEMGQTLAQADELRNNYSKINEQKGFFENLKRADFISDQNRIMVRRRITNIQKYTKVLKASYNIQSAAIMENEELKKARHAVLKSPVSIEIEAMDDLDLFHFLYWVENGFPGVTLFTSITMKRENDVTGAVLRQIGGGNVVTLVKGTLNFDWYSMVPESQVQAEFESLGDF